MDAQLRKRHKYIWLVLAVVLPVLLVFVIKDLDFSSQKAITEQLARGSILKEIKTDAIHATLRKQDSGYLLEVNLKQPLQSASNLLQGVVGTSKDVFVIGQLEGVGLYRFDLDRDIDGIMIYDAFKEQEIQKLEF